MFIPPHYDHQFTMSDDGTQRRRRFLKATGGAAAAVTLPGYLARGSVRDSDDVNASREQDTLKVAMVLPGSIDDGGFMEAGYDGLQSVKNELGAETAYIDEVTAEMDSLTKALNKLAANNPDLIIAHGGQNSEAVAAVAPGYPDIKFVVTQGGVTGENLASYVVLQEQSTFLAGAAAGLLTESGVVGHISGIRVPPGLKGRAAYADGLGYTNPDATLLTTFAGDQDDVELARCVTAAQIEQGADPIFTMLNAGRQGAIKAAKNHDDVSLFGNVGEWYSRYPDVFAGSAIANVSIAVLNAARDVKNGDWQSGQIVEIGLENPDAVRLSLAPSIPEKVRKRTDSLAQRIIQGDIEVKITYDGPEFDPFEEHGQNDEDDDGDGAIDEDDEDGDDVPSNDDDDVDGATDEDDEPDDGDDGSDDFNGNAEDDDDGDGHYDEDDEQDGGNSDDVDNDGDGAVDEDDEPDTDD